MPVRSLLSLVLALAAFVAPSIATPPLSPPAIVVRVDPRVELLSLVFRLAGNPEYSMPNSLSPYAKEVERWFGTFRAHPAVLAARELRAQRGVSYDAVMSFAVHLTDTDSFGERVPFSPLPKRLDERWTPENARAFLEKLRAFAKASEFSKFTEQQKGYYEKSADRLRKTLADRARLEWFDTFFGARPGAEYAISVGLLNGGGNYGVGVIHADGREEITPVIGVWKFDADGLPMFGEESLPTIAHELCHSYTNPIVDRHLAALEPIGARLFERDKEKMTAQAYVSGKIVMYETLVRACVVRWRAGFDGPEGVQKEIADQKRRGFEWVGAVAGVLEAYERDRTTYATFDAFVPKLVEAFDQWEKEAADRDARAPKVLEIVPRSGAIDVDPAATELRVTFDRPMMDRSWSVCGPPASTPTASGEPSYDAERRVFRMPLKLEPGRAYRFSLNDVNFQGFKGEDGVPLKPVPITFSTKQ